MTLPEPVVTGIPIVVSDAGQPFIGCDAAVALLRAVAAVARDSEQPADELVAAVVFALTREADALDARAIAHTTQEDRR